MIGISLWAAKRIKNNGSPFKFAFPRYTNDHFSNANSASAALNKWLKPFVPENCVIHSFRHSFRDRLRNVECPFDIIDRLGGWITSGVGQKYGKGYDLKQLDTPHCKGYTIIDGWRFTTDSPRKSYQKVYLFGGSTIQNHEVPNKYTIASFLQRNLNTKGSNIKVNNRGFTTVVTSQQNQFLKKISLKKGDIVVYYDGANDQWQGVANNLSLIHI